MILRSLSTIRIWCVVAVVVGGGSTREAWAAVVLLKDRAEPVYGRIVRQDGESVVLRSHDAAGKAHDETFSRDQVEEILATVSNERLLALDPTRPSDYRDYAEELWSRRQDPEVRETAIRLYVIAAWLDRENLARSSLLGMIALARTPEEEKKFRAALFVNDPSTSLEFVDGASTSPGSQDNSAPQELLKALRLLRTNKGGAARNIAEKPAVAALLDRYSGVLTKAEFNAASGRAVLSPRELRQCLLLELEMEAIVNPKGVANRAAAPAAWSRQVQGEGGKPVPSLALETLTEFDPRKCRFRGGEWVER